MLQKYKNVAPKNVASACNTALTWPTLDLLINMQEVKRGVSIKRLLHTLPTGLSYRFYLKHEKRKLTEYLQMKVTM